ncbi:unnamed protein product, partial [Rotaria magnacalcarata]
SASNSNPHHEWCSASYCGYLQALEKEEEYDHTPHSLPTNIMKAIRPVFEELTHPDVLSKVVNGGSQMLMKVSTLCYGVYHRRIDTVLAQSLTSVRQW